MKFKEFLGRVQLTETHKFTTDADVARSNTNATSQDSYIKQVVKLVADGAIPFNTDEPQKGALVLDRQVLNFHVGDHKYSTPVGEEGSNLFVRRIRTYLYDPAVLPNMPRANADNFRSILKLFYNPEINQGVTFDGKSYDARFLVTAVSHELVHLSDPGIVKDRDEYFSTNKDYFDKKDNWDYFWGDTTMEPKKDGPMSWSPERFAKYHDTEREKKAQYGGYGYEMAHRLAGDSGGDRDAAMDRLKTMGMDGYIGTTPVIARNKLVRNHYEEDPTHQKKVQRAAFDYLDKLVPAKPGEERIGRGAEYYAKLKATDPEAYYALLKRSRRQPAAPAPKKSVWSRMFGR